ncbi:hypothetical protein B0H67DRAFT_555527 [Lasiosphaeris hirsuta]|uniref:DUF7137 domain-containing protein n=1 Tax=Lasiosphaeris hirsuta TaxID=260670 RepID=A0AA40A946_9PEZI|nr:hypothetical protein B0H67DRAFT_555527 [Lasiosphaeris hirsuta]
MRVTLSISQLAVALLSLTPVASAMSWPEWLPEPDALVVRQATSASATPTSDKTAKSDATPTSATKKVITTNLNTGGVTETGSNKNSTKTKSGNSKHTLYNPQDPAGAVVMKTPSITQGTQMYKIGDFVTWGWNYTNLQGTPTAVDVLVSCSKATQTWTLTQNMTFATAGSFTWDTGAYQETAIASPLLVEQYTLLIHDSDGPITATPEPGYLSPFSGFLFGLYTPRPYTPLGEWKCVTCSAGVSDMERRALGGAVAMSVLTVLSFTWFVGGIGALL